MKNQHEEELQPQALDMEEAVLGAMILKEDVLWDTIDILESNFFYKSEHRIIFDVIKELFMDSEPIDVLTVTNKLREYEKLEEVGGTYYISQLTNRVFLPSDSEYYARIVKEKYIRRELIKVSDSFSKNAKDETMDILDVFEFAYHDLVSTGERCFKTDSPDMKTLLKEIMYDVMSALSHEDGISATAVPSGFNALDRMTNGFHKSVLTVIAARPGMGKTAFALSMVKNIAIEQGKPIAYFSPEWPKVELVKRLLINEMGKHIVNKRLGNKQLGVEVKEEWEQLLKGALAQAPIFIDDTANLNMFKLRAKCRRLIQKHGIQMVIVDYLQLLCGSSDLHGDRDGQINQIIQQLKSLARELKVPVVVMMSLKETKECIPPKFSDLYYSRAIKEHADIVAFIHRPEYYGIEYDENGNSILGTADLLIEQQRSGPTGHVRLKFNKEFVRFENLE